METDFENLEVGLPENSGIESKPVKVISSEIRKIKIDDKKSADKVVLICEHPDISELLPLSSVCFSKNGKLKIEGLWFNIDRANQISKYSALSILLDFFKVKNIKELNGRTLPTVSGANGFLVIKAY